MLFHRNSCRKIFGLGLEVRTGETKLHIWWICLFLFLYHRPLKRRFGACLITGEYNNTSDCNHWKLAFCLSGFMPIVLRYSNSISMSWCPQTVIILSLKTAIIEVLQLQLLYQFVFKREIWKRYVWCFMMLCMTLYDVMYDPLWRYVWPFMMLCMTLYDVMYDPLWCYVWPFMTLCMTLYDVMYNIFGTVI
mgnify:CR=1 FL=1